MTSGDLFDTRLPINRKERYYTGTVLPGIICHDNLKHLSRFLKLLGIEDLKIDADGQSANVQFFTEYGLAESIFGTKTKERFSNSPPARDTPDILIFVGGASPHLIAVEAKMFDFVTPKPLLKQMARQKIILDYLSSLWPVPKLTVVHRKLLPMKLKGMWSTLLDDAVTWEAVVEEYQNLSGTEYFVGVLRHALENYDQLKAVRSQLGVNAEARLTGSQILTSHGAGAGQFRTMGRLGGANGKVLARDFQDSRWQKQLYEVSINGKPANSHWFTISYFVNKIS